MNCEKSQNQAELSACTLTQAILAKDLDVAAEILTGLPEELLDIPYNSVSNNQART